MTLQERKLNIINQLVHTNSAEFISNIEKLFKKKTIEEYEKNLKPMKTKELLRRAHLSEEAIKSGQVIAHEEVVEYFKRKKK